MSEETGPEKPAEGRNGRWVHMGQVSVDSSQLIVVDPTYVDKNATASTYLAKRDGLYGPYDTCGIQFLAGFGDGGYNVWGWVADYGDPNDPTHVDERISQVTMTLIDAADLKEWHCTEPGGWPLARGTFQQGSDLITVTGPKDWLRRFAEGEKVTRVQAAEDESEWIETTMTNEELDRLYKMLV